MDYFLDCFFGHFPSFAIACHDKLFFGMLCSESPSRCEWYASMTNGEANPCMLKSIGRTDFYNYIRNLVEEVGVSCGTTQLGIATPNKYSFCSEVQLHVCSIFKYRG